jgi:membrane protease YdiL (CAAX protease family)
MTGSTPAQTLSLIAIGVMAPLLLAPLVEELFFRGTLLTSLEPPTGRRGAMIFAVVLCAVIFAIPHMIGSTNIVNASVAFSGATILGLGSGALAIVTRRVGASIVAHVTFNGALLLLLVV